MHACGEFFFNRRCGLFARFPPPVFWLLASGLPEGCGGLCYANGAPLGAGLAKSTWLPRHSGVLVRSGAVLVRSRQLKARALSPRKRGLDLDQRRTTTCPRSNFPLLAKKSAATALGEYVLRRRSRGSMFFSISFFLFLFASKLLHLGRRCRISCRNAPESAQSCKSNAAFLLRGGGDLGRVRRRQPAHAARHQAGHQAGHEARHQGKADGTKSSEQQPLRVREVWQP